MKLKIGHILILFALSVELIGCNSDESLFTLNTPEDKIQLTSSPDSTLILSKEKADENALKFTWNEASNLDAKEIDYYFKIGLEGNGSMTTDTTRLSSGQTSLFMTNAQLNRLLTNWNVTAGVPVAVEATLLAIPKGTSTYEKPEKSSVILEITSYDQPKNALFICGSANPLGSNPAHATEMDMGLDNSYTWTGFLQPGKLRFTLDQYSDFPAYQKGSNDFTLKYDEVGADSATSSFEITETGLYTISIDLEELTVSISHTNIDNIWMIGDALPYGWNFNQIAAMKQNNTNEFTYEGPLYAGEIKFPLTKNGSFTIPYFMSQKPDESIIGDTNFDYITAAQSTSHDDKWSVPSDGNYKLTINVDNRTLTCENIDLSAVYNEFFESDQIKSNHFRLYMVGDATPNGWDIGNATPMYYNAAADPDCFMWEGRLSKGELKLPLISNGKFEVPYFMSASSDENPSSQGNDLTFVDNSNGNQPDRKWYIPTTGYYQVKVNLKERKIYFILDKSK
jgi:hypothetical protein